MEKDKQDKTEEVSQRDETVRRWKKIQNATNGKEEMEDESRVKTESNSTSSLPTFGGLMC